MTAALPSSPSVASPSTDREPRTGVPASPHPVRGDFTIRFPAGTKDWAAMRAAEAWCKARGFSVGILQAGAPRGLLLGSFRISKWRNLDAEDRADLHGIMEAPGRTWRKGPVTITIRRDAPAAVIEAFRSEVDPEDAAAQRHVEGVES